MKRSGLIIIFLLISTTVAFADPFQITLSSNGNSRSFSFDTVQDVINTFSGSSLSTLLPGYTNGSAATATANLRGLDASLSYGAGSNTLTLNVPSIGLVRSFTGATRDQSQTLLKDFFEGQEGQADLTRVLQALAAKTPLDPVAGNPNSLLSQMGDRDFLRGTDYLEGMNVAASQAGFNGFGADISNGWYTNHVSDETVTTAALTYNHTIPGAGFSVLMDLPLTYINSEGASSYTGSLGVGARVPIIQNTWSLTPIIRVGGAGSEDLGSGAVIYSGALVSDLRYAFDKENEIQLGDMVGYYKTDSVSVGSYNIDYNLQNTRFTNGLAFTHAFQPELKGRLFFNDTRFVGDSLYNEYYDEVGFSMLTPLNPISSVEIKASYLFADNYDGVKIGLDLKF